MTKGTVRLQARWPRVMHALPLALVCALMAVLGPLAALALASSGGAGLGGGTTASGTTKSGTTKTGPTKTGTTKSGTTKTTTSTTSTTGTTGTGSTVTVTTVSGTTTTVNTYPAPSVTAAKPRQLTVPKVNPFARRGMWIWMLSSTDGGSVSKIIAAAKAEKIGTLYIKSGDGASNWSQFNATLVSELHAAGLKVCAWQFVYGTHPVQEAKVGADAVREGADCLLIDAETQYQGKYAQAQTYMTGLRAAVGKNFPIALAGFPYVSYHPSFPYSVFLGPGGAQYNAPQMYWDDIGTSVEGVYATTYSFNEIYQRPIYPIGQLYASGTDNEPPSAAQIELFNRIASDYGATGTSWYDWQEASGKGLAAISQTATNPRDFTATTTAASLGSGAEGDVVIWAQEHLDWWIRTAGAGYGITSLLTIDGDFGQDTVAAVKAFQAAHDIDPTGVINGTTWNVLLEQKSVGVRWVQNGSGASATVQAADRTALHRRGSLIELVPRFKHARPERNELGGETGRGRP